jgi:hypothetical protein
VTVDGYFKVLVLSVLFSYSIFITQWQRFNSRMYVRYMWLYITNHGTNLILKANTLLEAMTQMFNEQKLLPLWISNYVVCIVIYWFVSFSLFLFFISLFTILISIFQPAAPSSTTVGAGGKSPTTSGPRAGPDSTVRQRLLNVFFLI